jgi:hypothetical protein
MTQDDRRRPIDARGALGLALVLTFALATAAVAEKTDVVKLKNGDQVTGEIDHLQSGLLVYKTDNMGTLNIEWEDIAEVTSKHYFRVELESGTVHYGSLVTPPHPEAVQVAEVSGNVLMSMADIANIRPISRSFWKRFDADLDAGFSFTQANSATQWSLSTLITYQVEQARAIFSGSSLITDQESVEATSRHDVSLAYRRRIRQGQRLSWFAQGEVQSNEELGLQLRVLGAGGLAQYVFQTYRSYFVVASGLAVSEEYASGSTDKSTSTELLGHAELSYATYDYPKTELAVGADVYPSVSDWWRVRFEANASVKREVAPDFFVKLSPFESYDSDPPVAGASKNDWGITMSIGWSY